LVIAIVLYLCFGKKQDVSDDFTPAPVADEEAVE
jgi:hypothetical protein